MKNKSIGIFSLFLSSILFNSCSSIIKADLNALTVTKESNYQSQLNMIKAAAKAQLISNGNIVLDGKELSIAPFVAKLDFQNKIKLKEVNARALAEDRAWWGVPDGIWGFEYSIDNASAKFDDKIIDLKIKPYGMGEESIKLKSSSISFPVDKVDLNGNLPSQVGTVISNKKPAFDAVDGLKVAKTETGTSFFSYVNITLKKQGITMNKMNDEKVLNYEAAINGYFQVCDLVKCISAKFPDGKGISFIMPLPHSHAYDKENREKTSAFAQEFLGDVISEISFIAFNKLVTIQ